MISPLKLLGFRLFSKLAELDRCAQRRKVQKCRAVLVTGNLLVDTQSNLSFRVLGHNQNSALLEGLATGAQLVVRLPKRDATHWDGQYRWVLQ